MPPLIGGPRTVKIACDNYRRGKNRAETIATPRSAAILFAGTSISERRFAKSLVELSLSAGRAIYGKVA